MGRYKRDLTFYNNRWQRTEDLIADAYTFAQRKPAETIEIAAHLMSQAFEDQDDALMDVARDLMRVAGSPCRFKAEENSDKATDTNNRPSEPIVPDIPADLLNDNENEDEEWDDSMDYIFNKKVNPHALFNAMKRINYPSKIKDRRFYYIAYRVYDAINYFSKGTSEHQYLQWINLHFNDKEHKWIDDHDHIYLFRFKLDGSAKELKVHPSKWNTITMYSDLAEIHYNLANSLKNTFEIIFFK